MVGEKNIDNVIKHARLITRKKEQPAFNANVFEDVTKSRAMDSPKIKGAIFESDYDLSSSLSRPSIWCFFF